MGQSCIKSPQGNPKLINHQKCKHCNMQIVQNMNHKCCVTRNLEQMRPIFIKNKPSYTINQGQLLKIYGNGLIQAHGQFFNIKVFKNEQRTQSIWRKQPTYFFPIKMRQFSFDSIRNRSFQQKLYWFRLNIQNLRITWQNGSQTIYVDRSNILMSSKYQLQKINLRKQVKIVFNDQKVSDAGGLLREYMHLALKQIFSPQTGIFQMSQNKELTYKFKWDDNLVDQYVIENMKILGLIIGKALFQRISINCYLDRTVLRQITGQPVHFEDFYTYDQNIYKSLHSILNSTGADEVALNFCIYHQVSGIIQLKKVQLIKNGENTMVNDLNKAQYAKLLIHQYCTVSCKKYLSILRQYIYKVIPFPLISIFQPIQLQMLLHGPSNIDIQDWRQNTLYKGYSPNDKQILWFWQFVNQQSQQKLRHLLHYVTGTTRVPILGFKYLESNRNQIVKFTIQKCDYEKGNPYPKGYTCFNRLQLPVYKKKEEMFQKLKHLIQNQLTHFGLD